jgi:hypothetical protein
MFLLTLTEVTISSYVYEFTKKGEPIKTTAAVINTKTYAFEKVSDGHKVYHRITKLTSTSDVGGIEEESNFNTMKLSRIRYHI